MRATVLVMAAATILGCERSAQQPTVVGEIAEKDLREVLEVIASLTDEPILSINAIRPGKVEVDTGEVRGPLDGDGSFFELEKKDGRWIVVDKGRWVS